VKEYEKMKYFQKQSKKKHHEKKMPSANKILRDHSNSSYSIIKPRDPKDQEALKDVIASQKRKIDNFLEREAYYQQELKTREKYIGVLQAENQEYQQDRAALKEKNRNAL